MASHSYASTKSETHRVAKLPLRGAEMIADAEHQLDSLDEDLVEEGLGEQVQMTCQCLGSLLSSSKLTFHSPTSFVYSSRFVKSLLRPPIV